MPKVNFNSVSTPICTSTSYVIEPNTKSTITPYSRMKHLNESQLIAKIKNLYSAGSVQLFPSGMSAITSVLTVYSSIGNVFLVSSEMYCDTYRSLNYLQDKIGIKVVKFDITDPSDLINKTNIYKDNLKIIMLESCSNPSGYMIEPNIFKDLKKICKNLKIIIDNSWLTPIIYNPYTVGANYVIDSMSKYMGGGNVIMGCVCGSKKDMKTVVDYAFIHGLHVSPYDCYMAEISIGTLDMRMKYVSKLAYEVATLIKSHPATQEIIYPSFEEHPSYPITKKYFNNLHSGIIYFRINKCREQALVWASRENILLATSYGKEYTLIDPYTIRDKEKGESWIRLAIGYNCPNLIKDIKEMMDELT